jgi:putative DNA-invertase from lambdoid prophage Rac
VGFVRDRVVTVPTGLTAFGRNYTDVVDTIREFMRRGVIIKTVITG